ncbi:MAG: HNH endonuclease [Nitrososphaerota archaeon]|jgi:hypothetical protein|nr:HNH endonuclease [Nitrososphaerota archaeon]
MSLFWDEEKRPTPTKLLKMKVYERDHGVCRLCGKKVSPFDFEVGHDRAHSRGGKLTLKNALLLHPACNRSMRTLTLRQVRSSIGLTSKEDEAREALRALKLPALRWLAKKHHLSIMGRVEEGLFSDTRIPPSKTKFVNALAKVIPTGRVQAELAGMPVPKKRRRRRESGWSIW